MTSILRVWKIRQVRFVAMGLVNTASNLATFALVHVLTSGHRDWLAVIASNAVGVSVAFVTQRTVVFDAGDRDGGGGQAARFLTVYATGIAVNIVLLAGLKGVGIPPVVAQAIALLLIAGGTYVGHARWTFRPPDEPGPEGLGTSAAR